MAKQIKNHIEKGSTPEEVFTGNFKSVVSTGSTLLDLAISGNRIYGGGIPGGVLVEAFGPSQSGKTVLLSEVGGNVLRAGGQVRFDDPEGRLDMEFSSLFGLKLDDDNYAMPNTVTEVFKNIRAWSPENISNTLINGCFTDSLAALSTDMEMDSEEGDKMGTRRAKEFSEQLRKSCRIIKQKNYIHVCSNQIRENVGMGEKYTTPGGMAVKFYASIRLKFDSPEKIVKEVVIGSKAKAKKVIGIKTTIEVVKSVDDPYRKAPLYIIYGYGIDDIRANLQYIKEMSESNTYIIGGKSLGTSLDKSIEKIESDGLQDALKKETIQLWTEIESKFKSNRVKKLK